MIDRSKELELSLGDGLKKIEDNELETVILQRRSLRVNKQVNKNRVLKKNILVFLGPALIMQ